MVVLHRLGRWLFKYGFHLLVMVVLLYAHLLLHSKLSPFILIVNGRFQRQARVHKWLVHYGLLRVELYQRFSAAFTTLGALPLNESLGLLGEE